MEMNGEIKALLVSIGSANIDEELLAEVGVIPNLRPISPHPLRAGEVKVERPSAERLLKLARATKKVLEDQGLRADLAETMCLPCTGCDITPQRDI